MDINEVLRAVEEDGSLRFYCGIDEGLVLTNFHVIKGADGVTVKLSSKQELRGRIIGTDTKTDLALLKVSPKKPLPSCKIEHVEVAHPDDIADFKRLGVVASVQPSHMTYDRATRQIWFGTDQGAIGKITVPPTFVATAEAAPTADLLTEGVPEIDDDTVSVDPAGKLPTRAKRSSATATIARSPERARGATRSGSC